MMVILPEASEARKMGQQAIYCLSAQQKFSNHHGEICKVCINGARPVTLAANSEKVVWCRARPGIANVDYEAYLDPIEVNGPPLVKAARILVTICNGRVPVRLVNLSKAPVDLPKYHAVAQLCEVNPEDILPGDPKLHQRSIKAQQHSNTETNTPWWSESNVGDANTPANQINGVLNVAKRHYQALSKDPLDFGKTTIIQHHINTGNHPPFSYSPVPGDDPGDERCKCHP
ncbi:uncharacterized protein [Dendropsophus ebraccatus]|uniref:uncharacterized protein isoform X2 n=1 Tax=Dendropsophus ebraccatus TaxID=150705 RepID=UPI00383196BD